jgi:hypothetical protein
MRRKQNHLRATKIDSIMRLTYVLERDINKITGIQDLNQEIDKNLHQNAKLDVISNKLLEIRDKLEINSRNNSQSNFQQNGYNTNFVPNNYCFNNPNVMQNNVMPYQNQTFTTSLPYNPNYVFNYQGFN